MRAKTGEFLAREGFRLGRDDLEAVAKIFASEAEKVLAGEASSLLMLDSGLTIAPDTGSVVSPPVIVVDAGGTNLRVAAVRLTEAGSVFTHIRKSEMPGTHGAVSADAFHAAIAAEVDAVRVCEPQTAAIGYCFSYGCRPVPGGDAELLAWSKQIEAPEVIGQRVGRELVRRLLGEPMPIIVLNDTVATLLAGLSRPGDPRAGHIGFILGTGTNLACIENGAIRNAETGECDKVPRTSCDVAFDASLPDAGAAPFEKMVAGAYLGGVGLELLKRAAADGLLAGDGFASIETVSACELDAFASGDTDRQNPLTSAIRTDDAEVAREIIRAVFCRAARLTAAHPAAFVRRSAQAGRVPVRITVDGSTYWKVRAVDFDGLVRQGLAELVPTIPCEIFRMDEAPMVGAAVAAAHSVRVKTGETGGNR